MTLSVIEKYTFVPNYFHSIFFTKHLETVEFGKFRRGDRDDRGGSDRPRSGDREDRGGSDRPRSGDREDRGGSDRPRSGDRDGGNRFGGGGGNRFGGGGGGNRFGGGGGGDRSRYERSDRSGGGDRPRFERGGSSDRGGDRGGDRGDRGGFDKESEESVFSKKVRAGKRRTYFFDVRKTRGEDYFITITESTRREDGFGYKRHKIFLYKEDFNRFAASLSEVVNHVKTELMPDFDYEEFDRRQAEWEAQNKNEDDDFDGDTSGEPQRADDDDFSEKAEKTPAPKMEKTDTEDEPKTEKDDDDVSW